MELLPETEQQFILEVVKKISISHDSVQIDKMPNQKETVKRFIRNINAITDEPLDNEFDEIIKDRINITRELDL